MPSVDGAQDQLHARVDLGRTPSVIFKTEGRSTADLAETCQLRKHLETVFIELFFRLSRKRLAHMDHLGIVQIFLFAVKAHIPCLFQFFRQVAEYVFLQPAQDKRPCHLLQPFHHIFVLVFHDRRLDLSAECLIPVQESRHEIIKDAPKLTEPVFDRRPGQRETVPALYDLHSFRSCRCMVFNVLGLINDLAAEFFSFIKRNIPAQSVIGSHEHVIFSILFNLFPPLLLVPRDHRST